jgi:hypothetical protein
MPAGPAQPASKAISNVTAEAVRLQIGGFMVLSY